MEITTKTRFLDTFNPNTDDPQWPAEMKEFAEANGYTFDEETNEITDPFTMSMEEFIQNEIDLEVETFWDSFKFANYKRTILPNGGEKVATSDTPCIIKVDIGRWNGRRCGYAKYDNIFTAVSDFFDNVDYHIIDVDNETMYLTGIHHDGRNYAEIKLITKDDNWKYDELLSEDNCMSEEEILEMLFEDSKVPFTYEIMGC